MADTGSRYTGMRFTGAVAVVTGASRGIGLAVAQRLVDEGARVCITARDAQVLAETVERLGGPDRALGVAGRADDREHQQRALQLTLDTFGPPTVLVNNAGINPAYGPLLELSDSAARKIMDVNVLATLSWTRLALDAGLGDDGAGTIVNMASVAGLRPSPGIAYYGVSKRALMGLTEQLAAELAPRVRVNAVAPAVVKTVFAGALYEGREEEVAADYPLGRLGLPEDVAGCVAFLASPDAAWITGQTVVVDGGRTLAGGT